MSSDHLPVADTTTEAPSDVRLLVVDDDRACRDTVRKLLEGRGYEIDTASCGTEALELIAARPYALAVLDYQMPGMNGVELYQKMQEVRGDMAAIFLTAFTTLDTVYPAIAAGVERVLAKPVRSDELLPLVDSMVRKAGGEQPHA
jgi:two-component system response regulator MprA